MLNAIHRVVLATILFAAPGVWAQVAAPSMVEDELPPDVPSEEPRRAPARSTPTPARGEQPPVRREPAPARSEPAPRPGERIPEPVVQPPPEPSLPPAAAPAPPPPARAAGTGATAIPGVTISAEELKKLQRPIEPVKANFQQILELWQERRRMLREQNVGRAQAAQAAILEAMKDLGIENLPSLAAAQVREAYRSLSAKHAEDALEQARFAAALAPDSPDVHLAVFRAQLSKEPGNPLPALAELWATFNATAAEPRAVRALYADLTGAGLAALLTASGAAIVLLFLRKLRLILHDARHLPLLRAGTPMQAALLVLVLVALPLILQLGPLAALLMLAAAAWLYLATAERIVATVALAALIVTPYLALAGAHLTAWTGTPAEQVFELEHGGDCGERAPALATRAEHETLPPQLLAALARCYKRQGALDKAVKLYQRAASADGASAEVQVNLGNVLFLKGDLEGAKAAYLAATDRATQVTTLAVAHYDLSKLYLRQAAVEQSSEARKKAQLEDPEYLERYGSEDDFRANRWVLDVAVPTRQLAGLATVDGTPQRIFEAVRGRLAGPLAEFQWPMLPAATIGLLWLLTLLGGRIGSARICEKCGRPACRRCDGQQNVLCGQCVNVFQRKGLVDSRDRQRKELAVRRYVQRERLLMRALTVLGGGAGILFGGRPIRGYLLLLGTLFAGFLVWFWRGVAPAPFASIYPIVGKLVVALPLGIALYGLALRDAFRG